MIQRKTLWQRQKAKIIIGQICIMALLKHVRKKDSLSFQQKAVHDVIFRSTRRKDIVRFLRILKLHKYLKRAKLRYGNAVTADILW